MRTSLIKTLNNDRLAGFASARSYGCSMYFFEEKDKL
ncbi:hypothetical protein EV144_103401 [Flavobacterium sp. 270]|nr:hypothetical protein EV144_103401 [Flavobacterium sp. 270]